MKRKKKTRMAKILGTRSVTRHEAWLFDVQKGHPGKQIMYIIRGCQLRLPDVGKGFIRMQEAPVRIEQGLGGL